MLGALMTVMTSQIGLPTSVTPEEMAEARRWVAAKFEGIQEKQEPAAGLNVLANHAAVELNARSGKPLRIVDKQYTRDYLTETGWDRKPPPPELPAEVAARTGEKYREAFHRITGQELIRP